MERWLFGKGIGLGLASDLLAQEMILIDRMGGPLQESSSMSMSMSPL
jgi:hypothetical protein